MNLKKIFNKSSAKLEAILSNSILDRCSEAFTPEDLADAVIQDIRNSFESDDWFSFVVNDIKNWFKTVADRDFEGDKPDSADDNLPDIADLLKEDACIAINSNSLKPVAKCPCGGIVYERLDLCLTSNPPKHYLICNKCGAVNYRSI